MYSQSVPLHPDTENVAAARAALRKAFKAPSARVDPPDTVQPEDWAAMLHMRAVVRGDPPAQAGQQGADVDEDAPYVYTPEHG